MFYVILSLSKTWFILIEKRAGLYTCVWVYCPLLAGCCIALWRSPTAFPSQFPSNHFQGHFLFLNGNAFQYAHAPCLRVRTCACDFLFLCVWVMVCRCTREFARLCNTSLIVCVWSPRQRGNWGRQRGGASVRALLAHHWQSADSLWALTQAGATRLNRDGLSTHTHTYTHTHMLNTHAHLYTSSGHV